jgi:Animal haem peroxidase
MKGRGEAHVRAANRQRNRGITRRQFLGGLGLGAVAVGARGALTLGPAHAPPPATPSDRFGRMFELPPFADPTDPELPAKLRALGARFGPLDAQDHLEVGPIRLITDPSFNGDLPAGNPSNPNNFTHTAGGTFMGQFMDHDMTFDVTSLLGVPKDPLAAVNARTPRFDLDSVYGGGPAASPLLYEADGMRFRVESGGLFEDLPRAGDGTAIIADPRNDENMMISGLHAAFLLFHNHVVDMVQAGGMSDPGEVFAKAKRLTTWHYQWMVLHEFLPLFVGQDRVDRALVRRRHYRPRGDAFIPVEFQGAVFRFGHSMVRPSYRANLAGDVGGPFFGMVFDQGENASSDPDDLRGGHRAPRRFIGWQTFFTFPGFESEVKPNKKIDTNISSPLFDLTPGTIAGAEQAPHVLPQRTLLRHITWLLPSGQAIAAEMGVPVLSNANLSELRTIDPGFVRSTPLFYYILKEAELMENGERLGQVGGTVVAEVIVGLLQLDPDSFLSVPGWRPELPTIGGEVTGDFRMGDFLAFAGVDPASRGQ